MYKNTDRLLFQIIPWNLLDKKIRIVREPVDEAWGRVAVFEDLSGNLWDLIEPVH